MPEQPFLPLLPIFETTPLRPVSDVEVEATIMAAIRAGAGARIGRDADTYLATLCARVIADRLAYAGLVVARRDHPE